MNKNDLLEKGYIITANTLPKKKSGIYLWGEFMHGDADAYTTSDIKLDSVEELEAILRYIAWKDSMNHNAEVEYRQRNHGEKAENDFYAQAGEEWRKDYLWDGVIDWWPRDVTYDDIRASLQKTWIIFVDEDGLEYKVVKP